MSPRRVSWRFLLLTGPIALLLAGCMLTLTPSDGGADNGDGDGTGGDTTDTLTVRVVNLTNVSLDPEIYVSAEPVSVDELFQPANKYTAFGVGTTGILADRDSDTFALDCSQARLIGTRGGRFGDDLNNPEGTGQQVVLTQELSVFCEGSVTFTYARAGDGFTTAYIVTR